MSFCFFKHGKPYLDLVPSCGASMVPVMFFRVSSSLTQMHTVEVQISLSSKDSDFRVNPFKNLLAMAAKKSFCSKCEHLNLDHAGLPFGSRLKLLASSRGTRFAGWILSCCPLLVPSSRKLNLLMLLSISSTRTMFVLVERNG